MNLIILHLLYYIQPFTCIIDDNNNNNNINNNNNDNHNHNHNKNDNDNENDQSSIFNLLTKHLLYL